MPRTARTPTRANHLANALAAVARAQRELAEVRLTGIPRPQAAEVKAARAALKAAAEASDAALRAERPHLMATA